MAQKTRTRIDVVSWLSRTTLDIIGLAGLPLVYEALQSFSSCNIGFHSNLGNLDRDKQKNELNEALRVLFRESQKFSILSFLQAWFPILRLIVRNLLSVELLVSYKVLKKYRNLNEIDSLILPKPK